MTRALVGSVVVGGACAAGTGLYAAHDLSRAMAAWTAAFGFGVAAALSAMVLVFVLHLADARWWLPVRRPIVACATTIPLFALAFLPIAATLAASYPWETPPAHLDEHALEAIEHQRAWNNPPFFLARAGVYFVTWIALALALARVHARYTRGGREAALASARTLSAVALPIVGFTLTFASFDWLMSRQPGWVSSMYGVYVFASGLVAATSIAAIGAWARARRGRAGPDHVHATGRLMLMSVVFWAYIAFFQLMLVWIADLPHEVAFYQARSVGAWAVVDVVLGLGHFAVPFVLLLSRPLKRSAGALAALAAWLLVMDALGFAWLVLPSSTRTLAWADLLPFGAVAAFAVAYGLFSLRPRVSEPVTAPAFQEALRYRSP